MASLTLLDRRDLPEVLHKRGQLYLAAFCALGLCFQTTASTRPQSDGVLDGFFLLVGLLAVTTGALAFLLLRKSRAAVVPGTWARTPLFPVRRAAAASRPPGHLPQLAVTSLLMIAFAVERRLIPVTRHLLSSSLSFFHSRARRWFLDSGPVEDPDETMESLASWRSTRLSRPSAVQPDLSKLSPNKGEATKAPPKPARPVPTPLPKHEPWSRVLADFEEQSKRRTKFRR